MASDGMVYVIWSRNYVRYSYPKPGWAPDFKESEAKPVSADYFGPRKCTGHKCTMHDGGSFRQEDTLKYLQAKELPLHVYSLQFSMNSVLRLNCDNAYSVWSMGETSQKNNFLM
jgi:hypothetical protein